MEQRIITPMPSELVDLIDRWRGRQSPLPSRSKAIRTLLSNALGAVPDDPEDDGASEQIGKAELRRAPGRPLQPLNDISDYENTAVKRALGASNTVEIAWLITEAFPQADGPHMDKRVERILTGLGWRKALNDRDEEVWTNRKDITRNS